jgi:hypothetical protein
MRTKTHTRYTELWNMQFTVCYGLALLCIYNDTPTYSLVIQPTPVPGLDFKFSVVHSSW